MLEKKIAESLDLLSKAENTALRMNPEDGFFLAFSGGKDSQVIYHLCKLAGVKFKAYYSVTGIDSPETIYFIRDNFPDVLFLHHKQNFFELVADKGLPTMQRRFCCERLKEHFGAGKCVLTGVRAEESKKRASYAAIEIYSRRKEHQNKPKSRDEEWLMETEHQCIKGQDKLMIRPILNWTTSDVYQYLYKIQAKINPEYAKHNRVGCMICPFANRKSIEIYEKEYPRFKEILMKSLKRFWEKQDEHYLDSPEEYYEWWKSKQSVKYYNQKKKQMTLQAL